MIEITSIHVLMYKDGNDREPASRIALRPTSARSIAIVMEKGKAINHLEESRPKLEEALGHLFKCRCEVYYEI